MVHMTKPTKPTSADPLLILAMDHRESFAKQFGVKGEPTVAQNADLQAAKSLIYQGVHAAAALLSGSQVGVLVDEQLGASVLRAARADGLIVAMPVEKSGQAVFELAYGDATMAHVDEFDPDYVKVLVRMNPADDPAATDAQLSALVKLSDDLRRRDRALLYELLVPPTEDQLIKAGGQEGYDRAVRPELVTQVIAMNQAAGVEPRLWKIEGLESSIAARAVVAAAKASGRDADCIVLGRDAPRAVLDNWLAIAAPVDGFVGFAVGRSIWEDPLAGFRSDRNESALVEAVRANYLHYARVYLDAR